MVAVVVSAVALLVTCTTLRFSRLLSSPLSPLLPLSLSEESVDDDEPSVGEPSELVALSVDGEDSLVDAPSPNVLAVTNSSVVLDSVELVPMVVVVGVLDCPVGGSVTITTSGSAVFSVAATVVVLAANVVASSVVVGAGVVVDVVVVDVVVVVVELKVVLVAAAIFSLCGREVARVLMGLLTDLGVAAVVVVVSGGESNFALVLKRVIFDASDLDDTWA